MTNRISEECKNLYLKFKNNEEYTIEELARLYEMAVNNNSYDYPYYF